MEGLGEGSGVVKALSLRRPVLTAHALSWLASDQAVSAAPSLPGSESGPRGCSSEASECSPPQIAMSDLWGKCDI